MIDEHNLPIPPGCGCISCCAVLVMPLLIAWYPWVKITVVTVLILVVPIVIILVIGRMIDAKEGATVDKERVWYHRRSHQCLYMSRILGKIAALSRIEETEERKGVDRFLEAFQIHCNEQQECVTAFYHSKGSEESLQDNIRSLLAYMGDGDKNSVLITMYEWCWIMAALSPQISQSVASALKDVCLSMNLPESRFEELSAKYQYKFNHNRTFDDASKKAKNERINNANDNMKEIEIDPNCKWAYDRLKCKPNVSNAELKKAYHREVMQWHPDKFHMDAENSIVSEFIKQGMAEVTKARDILRNSGRDI